MNTQPMPPPHLRLLKQELKTPKRPEVHIKIILLNNLKSYTLYDYNGQVKISEKVSFLYIFWSGGNIFSRSFQKFVRFVSQIKKLILNETKFLFF